MATILRFQNVLTGKLLVSSPTLFPDSRFYRTNRYDSCTGSNSMISASSAKKPRANRKTRSDDDLARDIKEFLASVGLPEDHVPSMKVLSKHGRQDLANIVRRRGYKFIGQLLAPKRGSDLPEMGTDQAGNIDMGSLIPANESPEVLGDFGESKLSCSSETNEEPNPADHDSPYSSSLEEKVANFIEHGELDALVDDESRCREDGDNEPKTVINGSREMNGNSHKSMVTNSSWGFQSLPVASVASFIGMSEKPDLDEDPAIEETEYEDEINQLKRSLHQKEMELIELKQLIEKETLVLSALQVKVESEISKAQELVTQTESELVAAEESLSELVETEVLFSSEGEIIELAGSFNGWCNKINMEEVDDAEAKPHSSEPPEKSRGKRIWRTALWLYPGVYEIKFIVDGKWEIDAGREFITRGNIQNNILKVTTPPSLDSI